MGGRFATETRGRSKFLREDSAPICRAEKTVEETTESVREIRKAYLMGRPPTSLRCG